MAWTTPTTRATGDLITSSIWNTDLVNNIQYLHDTVTAARAYRSAALTVAGGNANTKIPLDTLYQDTGSNMDVTTNHRYNTPVLGWYQVNAQVCLNTSAVNVNEGVTVSIWRNGGKFSDGARQGQTDNNGFISLTVADVVPCLAGDYIELYVNSNGAWPLYVAAPANFNYMSVILL